MFSPTLSSSFGRPNAMAMAYRQIGVETSVESASPYQLVMLLFDGYMEALLQARGHMREGRIEQKGRCIGRAARIVEEGLKAGLNLREGGALAQDLHALYVYLAMRLTLANIRNDERILDECTRLVEPLQAAWREIKDQVDNAAN